MSHIIAVNSSISHLHEILKNSSASFHIHNPTKFLLDNNHGKGNITVDMTDDDWNNDMSLIVCDGDTDRKTIISTIHSAGITLSSAVSSDDYNEGNTEEHTEEDLFDELEYDIADDSYDSHMARKIDILERIDAAFPSYDNSTPEDNEENSHCAIVKLDGTITNSFLPTQSTINLHFAPTRITEREDMLDDDIPEGIISDVLHRLDISTDDDGKISIVSSDDGDCAFIDNAGILSFIEGMYPGKLFVTRINDEEDAIIVQGWTMYNDSIDGMHKDTVKHILNQGIDEYQEFMEALQEVGIPLIYESSSNAVMPEVPFFTSALPKHVAQELSVALNDSIDDIDEDDE